LLGRGLGAPSGRFLRVPGPGRATRRSLRAAKPETHLSRRGASEVSRGHAGRGKVPVRVRVQRRFARLMPATPGDLGFSRWLISQATASSDGRVKFYGVETACGRARASRFAIDNRVPDAFRAHERAAAAAGGPHRAAGILRSQNLGPRVCCARWRELRDEGPFTLRGPRPCRRPWASLMGAQTGLQKGDRRCSPARV